MSWIQAGPRSYVFVIHDVVIATVTHADLEDAAWTIRIDVDEA